MSSVFLAIGVTKDFIAIVNFLYFGIGGSFEQLSFVNNEVLGKPSAKTTRWLVSISTAAVAGLAMAATNVESSNIVGYTDEEFNGEYRLQSVQFIPIGGYTDDFNINEVLDSSLIQDFADELLVYDAASGDFITYLWDGATWIDALTDAPMEISSIPGSSFLALGDTWRFAGEVPSTNTIDIAVNAGEYCAVGGALPIDATLANFNWTPMADFADELLLYDAESGDLITYLWNTANWIDALTDAPLDFDTPINGFIFLTGEDSITERVDPFDYGA